MTGCGGIRFAGCTVDALTAMPGRFRIRWQGMTSLSLALVIFLSAFLALPGQAQVMTVSGSFNVAENGAATYSVPIAVPPGTAGMVPSLSLDYSSQGSNGLVGVGWSLAGLPSIGRCPRTKVHDNVRGSVNYDMNDRFCMEGQRLVLISGTYGADGSQYRTEIEGFSRIFAYGTTGNGPTWFKVVTRSGQTMSFGQTANSRMLAQGKSTVRSWALTQVWDVKWNYLTVTYQNDSFATGEAYPLRIDYTGNDAAGLTPYNSVRFVYGARSDIVPHYHAGSLMKNTVRLTNVRTYEGENVVTDYRLSYQQSPATLLSRMISATVCDSIETSANCLPATTFDYTGTAYPNGGPSGITTVTLSGSPPGNWNNSKWSSHYGDFNGDGRADILWVGHGGHFTTERKRVLWLSDGDGTFQTINNVAGQDGVAASKFQIGDYNGDGLSDIYIAKLGENGNCSVWLPQYCPEPIVWQSNGDGTFQALTSTEEPTVSSSGSKATPVIADLDSDGRSDILWLTVSNGTSGRFGNNTVKRGKVSGPMTPWLSNGDGTFTVKPVVTPPANYNSIGKLYGAEDFNGDGKADFFFQSMTTSQRQIWHSDGDGTFSVQTNVAGADGAYGDYGFSFADFNGDGKTDIFRTRGTNQGLWLSKGNGTFQDFANLNGADGQMDNFSPFLMDLNGDGKTDILFVNLINNTRILWRSKGDGSFVASTNYAGMNGVYARTSATALDFSGDGKTDILWSVVDVDGNDLGPRDIWLSDNVSTDLLSSFTTGLGMETEISYDSLSRNFPTCVVVWIEICTPYLYTKDSDAVYPVVDVQAPIHVVNEVEAADGIGGVYTSTYEYAGAKARLDGRGFLGFRRHVARDPQTGIVQTTDFRQDFPFSGMVASQTKKLGAQLLNSLSNTWSALPLSHGRQVVVMPQSVESSFDLDGSAIPPVTTTYQYDGFGHPTQIVISTPDGATKTTVNTYTNDIVNWHLGRLTDATVTSTVP